MTNQPGHTQGIVHEVRVILKRGRQVWELIPRRHKAALFGAAGVMAVTSAASTAVPVLLGKLVDGLNRGSDAGLSRDELYHRAYIFLALIAGAYLLREGLNVLRRYLVENSCTRIERSMTVKLVAHLMKVDLGALTHEKVGALHGRISRSVVGYARFIRLAFLDFFPVLLTGGFALAATVTKEPWLALVMAGVIPVSLILTVKQLLSQKGVRLTLIRSREEMDGTVVEQLGGIDYVRAANTCDREVERVAKAAEKRRALEIRHHFQMSLFGCAKALNEGLFHIFVLSLAIYLAIQEQISYGDILTFSMLFLNVMAPLSEVHRVLDEGHECSLMVADLLEMLGEPADRSFQPVAPREPRVELGQDLIAVDNLQVEYQSAEGKLVRALDGVSLTIKHGETVGVAGPSGSGKSTWLRVLMRLTHPCGGSLALGGVPLESLSRDAIGRLVGYVGQSPFIFAGTIRDNICYGCDAVSEDDIRMAARRASIHDEIMALPRGYDTLVSERGANLSGGQRQRLALARVFLKNPPILILDEGTSALDNISEANVQRALAEARADRTVIMVAHRLSTLVGTDRIFVFHEGRVVETGSFGELVLRDGLFAELVQCGGENNIVRPERPEPREDAPREAACLRTSA